MHKVLLLDDNHDNRFLTSRILKHLGCEVTEFGDPETALALLKVSNPFQIIFVDLHMPKMTGIEFMERVKTTYPDAKFVVTSLTLHPDEKQQALDSGAAFVIFEKQDKEAYKAVIEAVLQGR